jgi:hypothetical protein
MKDILSLMQEKPGVSAEVIRPMMLRYISVHQGISAKFIRNFPGRVILFLVRNPDFSNLTYDQAGVSLTSGRHIAAEEMTDLDNPFIRQNFSAMLRQIMGEDPATWEALTLMDNLKVSSPGFDYCVKKDGDGRPTGLVYMTAQMRYHARHYGTVLCLDAQRTTVQQFWVALYCTSCERQRDEGGSGCQVHRHQSKSQVLYLDSSIHDFH